MLKCWYQCLILAFASNSLSRLMHKMKIISRRIATILFFCNFFFLFRCYLLFSFHIKEKLNNDTRTFLRKREKELNKPGKLKRSFQNRSSARTWCMCAVIACCCWCVFLYFRLNGCRPGWLSDAHSLPWTTLSSLSKPRWPRPAWRLDLIYLDRIGEPLQCSPQEVQSIFQWRICVHNTRISEEWTEYEKKHTHNTQRTNETKFEALAFRSYSVRANVIIMDIRVCMHM